MNTYIPRAISNPLELTLQRGKSALLLGPRQTGKTTLLKHLNLADINYTLLDPERRLSFEKSPNLIRQEIIAYKNINRLKTQPLVVIDEVQKVPALMDIIQLMIDEQEAQFILTGSSVRKLRRHPQFNLLPGRVINFHLDPFLLSELPKPLPDIKSLLLYGSLPGIYLDPDTSTKQADLTSYVSNYLEEEIRSEALVRHLSSFAQFLEVAAVESGNQINVNKISQDLGVSRHAIMEYFNILEDCMIAEKIEALTQTASRKRLTKSPKYLLFDMGIRRILTGEGTQLSPKTLGYLFEQYIGLELLRMQRVYLPNANIRYWRDHAGPEIDYVIEVNKQFLPIEVKWTETPIMSDAKHLLKFMEEYDCIKPGIIICRCQKPAQLHENVLALPWQDMIQGLQAHGRLFI